MLLLPTALLTYQIEKHGLLVDMKYLNDLEAELKGKKEELVISIALSVARYWSVDKYKEDTGAKTAPEKLNLNSTQQLKWLLFKAMGLKTSGEPNVQAATLEEISNQHESIPFIQEYKRVSKLLSTYVTGMKKYIDPDDRVRCSFLAHGTETGRLSCTSPNLQNIPRGSSIKNMFVAPEGKYLLEVDYSGAELRVLAVVSDEPFLKEML